MDTPPSEKRDDPGMDRTVRTSARLIRLALPALVLAYASGALALYPSQVQLSIEENIDHVFHCDEVPILERAAVVPQRDGLVRALEVLEEVGPPGGAIDSKAILSAYDRLASECEGQSGYYGETILPDGSLVIYVPGTASVTRGDDFEILVGRNGHGFSLGLPGYETNAPYSLDEAAADTVGRAKVQQLKLIPDSDLADLFLLRTRQIHFTGKASDPGDRVVATQISFGRQYKDVPFIGSGSRIHLILGAGDLPSLIRVDWPEVADTGVIQQPTDVSRFELRTAGVLKAQDGGTLTQPLVMGIHSMMCGYFDPTLHSDEPYLELACEVALVSGDPESPNLEGIVVPLGEGASMQGLWGGEAGLAELEALGQEPGNVCVFDRHVKLQDND